VRRLACGGAHAFHIAPARDSLGELEVLSQVTSCLVAKEDELGDAIEFKDILEEVAGVYPRIMQEGDVDAGAWSCGMVAGLIHDIPTCKELIDRIMSGAEEIINQRLAGFLNA
jgi:nitronate monooxygenase